MSLGKGGRFTITPVSRYQDQFTSTPWQQPVFRMSVYNIQGKCKVLETNLKSEEISNFYPIFFIYFSTFIVIFFKTVIFSFRESYFQLVGLFKWRCTRMQFLLSVSRNRYRFTLAGYRNGKHATDPALETCLKYGR